jgi:peptidoglycan hydrolase-like protein with peptidoglycan-binding domain
LALLAFQSVVRRSAVDGRYGVKTESGVKDLQQRFQVTIDGVVGPQTWAIIDALEDEGPVS